MCNNRYIKKYIINLESASNLINDTINWRELENWKWYSKETDVEVKMLVKRRSYSYLL